jgi:two-component system heavy metal sensor histidine kinase CusS
MSSKSGPEGRPWSLAVRLTVWYAGSSFALVLAATAVLYWALAGNLDREDDEALADKVRAVRAILAERPGDAEALRQEVEATNAAHGTERIFLGVRDKHSGYRGATEGMFTQIPSTAFPHFGALAPDDQTINYRTESGRSFRLRAVTDDFGSYLIQVAIDRTPEAELLADYRRNLGAVLGAALVVGTLGGYRIARHGTRPVRTIAATARRIRPAHLGERIVARGLPAELRELADTFNGMLDRLEDAFARLARFSADIAHELRTPVNNLRGEVEVALTRPRPPEEYRDVLGSCLEECGRLARLIDSLLFLARAENPERRINRENVDVGGEFEGVRAFYEASAAEANVRLSVESPPGLAASLDRALFRRAVANLADNALSHTPAGGAVTLAALPDGEGVRVVVSDTGRGIPAEHLPYVFDRFYRADAARPSDRGNAGLGLAIVKGIAELHGGTATVASEPGHGTRVTLTFPPPADGK